MIKTVYRGHHAINVRHAKMVILRTILEFALQKDVLNFLMAYVLNVNKIGNYRMAFAFLLQ